MGWCEGQGSRLPSGLAQMKEYTLPARPGGDQQQFSAPFSRERPQ